VYSARTREEFAYLTELRALERTGRLQIVLTLTGGASRWAHSRGRADASLLEPLVESPQTLCFVCGPPAMLSSVSQALQRLGVSPRRIRTETW
jgi:ferredoxin-NADP reductase